MENGSDKAGLLSKHLDRLLNKKQAQESLEFRQSMLAKTLDVLDLGKGPG